MKKIIALLLVLSMAAGVFAGCGEKTEPQASQASQTPAATEPQTPAEPSEPAKTEPEAPAEPTPAEEDFVFQHREGMNELQEALVVTAEAYLARGVWVQYDDTRLINSWDSPATYRWQRSIRMPEDYTEQYTGYTNCAAFTYDVYLMALGYDITYWYTAALIKAKDSMNVFRYFPTGKETAAEKEEIKNTFLGLLEPGDIIVRRYAGDTGGHAMLYVGDGMFIHSTAPDGGNYDYSGHAERREPKGSIQFTSVETFFNDSSAKAHFFNCNAYAIVRPLNDFTGEIPEATVNRVEKMQGVVAQKISSVAYGNTVNPGDEITFTYKINNTNDHSVSLTIEENIPEYTTYVSGMDACENGVATAEVYIPAQKSVSITCKLTVQNDKSLYGEKIESDSTICGVAVNCPGFYIEPTLTDEQQKKITDAGKNAVSSGLYGVELINKIYTDALGKPSGLSDDAKGILSSLYVSVDAQHSKMDTGSKYAEMSVPAFYGGYYVVGEDVFGSDRVRGPEDEYFEIGDIILWATDKNYSGTQMYMKIDKNTLLNLNQGSVKLEKAAKATQIYEKSISYNQLAVIRPSMIMK